MELLNYLFVRMSVAFLISDFYPPAVYQKVSITSKIRNEQFFASFKVLSFLGKKYDAVFCYETSPVYMIFPAIFYSKIKKIPLTTYVLDLWPENLYSVLPIQNRFLQKVCEVTSHWHYRKSDKLIAMSPSLKDKLIAITDKSEDKVAVIPQYCEEFYEQEIYNEELCKK